VETIRARSLVRGKYPFIRQLLSRARHIEGPDGDLAAA
jgi:hypothetical protein